MATLVERVENLERVVLYRHPGHVEAMTWYRSIITRPVLRWIFQIEAVRPDKNSKKLYGAQTSAEELEDAMNLWKKTRKNAWINSIFRREYPLQFGSSSEIQLTDKNINIPSESETRRAFGILSASIHPESLDWANYYIKMFQDIPLGIFLRNNKGQLLVACYLSFSTGRAKYWRRKIGPQKLHKLPLPDWANNN
jgi:hypothetical protein